MVAFFQNLHKTPAVFSDRRHMVSSCSADSSIHEAAADGKAAAWRLVDLTSRIHRCSRSRCFIAWRRKQSAGSWLCSVLQVRAHSSTR